MYSGKLDMSLIDGLLIFIAIIAIYILGSFSLHKLGILKKYNITFWGPALMWRTNKGKKFLKKIAQKKRFWKAFGSSGVVLCFIMMILMVSLFIWQTWAISGFTQEQKEVLPGPEFVLVIPGINPILPLDFLWYIILGLIVAMVVHEFSHGILTFVSKLKVKSLGILYLIVPIGAFCEPDEKELKEAKPAPRMRIYAAGPTSNYVVVLISLLIFSFVFMGAIQPASEGAHVFSVDSDSPAYDLGINQGMIVTSLNNTDITNAQDYFETFDNLSSNSFVEISYVRKNQEFTKTIFLTDRYQEYEKRGYSNNITFQGKAYSGIMSLLKDDIFESYTSALKNPFKDFPNNFLLIYILPLWGYFQGYNPTVAPFTDSYIITGPLSVLPTVAFWIIVNALYWIFWLNLAVALFNVLPMVPLDGGFLFNDAIGIIVKKIKKDITKEKKEKLVGNISLSISLIILFLIIFPFIFKYIP